MNLTGADHMVGDGSNKPRVLAIGLDGATWTILKPLMDQGQLPNLKRLVEQGASGNLESTVPAHSGPGWTSFMTGVNPGQHGVFGFMKYLYGKTEVEIKPVTSQDIQAPTIFQILSDAKRVVGSINLPITYPPFPVNGFMVSDDLLRPYRGGVFTYPADLFQQIGWNTDDYNEGGVRLQIHDGRDKEFVKHCIQRVAVRLEVALRLMRDYPAWDFLTVVFTETDRIQHLLWHVLDPTHPGHDVLQAERLRPLLLQFFEGLDRAVGTLVSAAGPDTLICVLSDHGFGPEHGHFLVNQVFEAGGLLRLRTQRLRDLQRRGRGWLHRHVAPYRWTKAVVKALMRPQGLQMPPSPEVAGGALWSKRHGTVRHGAKHKAAWIVWPKTFAYCLAEGGSGVRVNLQGREPRGIVPAGKPYESVRQRMIDLLSGVKDPRTGQPLAIQWYRKEEVYHGVCMHLAPDLLCKNESPYRLNAQLHARNGSCFLPSTHTTGEHRQNGILVLVGPGVCPRTSVTGAELIDLAPTFLYWLGMPVPGQMDGKVLTQAFEPSFCQERPVIVGESLETVRKQADGEVYSEEDIEKIEQRLGDLGYLE